MGYAWFISYGLLALLYRLLLFSYFIINQPTSFLIQKISIVIQHEGMIPQSVYHKQQLDFVL